MYLVCLVRLVYLVCGMKQTRQTQQTRWTLLKSPSRRTTMDRGDLKKWNVLVTFWQRYVLLTDLHLGGRSL